jgi:hypothetical protein
MSIKTKIQNYINNSPHKKSLKYFYKNRTSNQYTEYNSYKEIVEKEHAISEFLKFILIICESKYVQIPGKEIAQDVPIKEMITPLVESLFEKQYQKTIMKHLINSVVVLHKDNVYEELKGHFEGDIIPIISIYLSSFSTEELPKIFDVNIVGKSIGTKCYVSYKYYENNQSIEDFIIHEIAHFFHNSKYECIGIKEIEDQFLLDIEYYKREIFAYSIEFYSKIKYLIQKGQNEKELLHEFEKLDIPNEESKIIKILVKEALKKRDGWQYIYQECKQKNKLKVKKFV